MKPIAVLGIGPAGLMAAHAVALSGHPVALFGLPDEDGKPLKSRLGGAQFLHDPLPYINDEEEPDAVITYKLRGTAEGYRRKVYGDLKVPFVSMEQVQHGHEQNAWNLRKTYDMLWNDLVSDETNLVQIDSQWVQRILDEGFFEAVLSSVPLPAICRCTDDDMVEFHHNFISNQVQIADEAMIEGDNTIVYNGTRDSSWHRSSILWGVEGTEYGSEVQTPLPTKRITKPLRTNCDCFAGDVVRLGRYGTWTKGVLTHHAFVEALKVVLP